MRKLVIFGTGKISDVAFHHFATDSDYEIVAFTTDAGFVPESGSHRGLPVIAFDQVEKKFAPDTHDLFVAVGYHDINNVRALRCIDARKKGYKLATYISSQNKHMSASQAGDNCFIMSGEPLQPETKIGNGNFIWSNATVGHHTQIADYCWVTSGVVIGGNCRIGSRCFLGLGATIGHEVKVGSGSIIGAHALVVKDAPENSVYIAAETPRFRLTSQQFTKMNTLK